MEGGSTPTVWKRRSSAPSFSMYLRYSLRVDAPTHCSSPRASAGLSMLLASIAPSAAPAPTSVCSSSMNRMMFLFWALSFITPVRGAGWWLCLLRYQYDRVLVLGYLVHHRLEPLLELAAVLGAGDDGRHVQREHAVVAERLRALAVGD